MWALYAKYLHQKVFVRVCVLFVIHTASMSPIESTIDYTLDSTSRNERGHSKTCSVINYCHFTHFLEFLVFYFCYTNLALFSLHNVHWLFSCLDLCFDLVCFYNIWWIYMWKPNVLPTMTTTFPEEQNRMKYRQYKSNYSARAHTRIPIHRDKPEPKPFYILIISHCFSLR